MDTSTDFHVPVIFGSGTTRRDCKFLQYCQVLRNACFNLSQSKSKQFTQYSCGVIFLPIHWATPGSLHRIHCIVLATYSSQCLRVKTWSDLGTHRRTRDTYWYHSTDIARACKHPRPGKVLYLGALHQDTQSVQWH